MVQPKRQLSVYGRWLLVQRVAVQGWSAATAAESMGVSRQTVYVWLRRWRAEGVGGLETRSCRPRRSPAVTDPARCAAILEIRRTRRWGPHRIAFEVGMPRSTIYAVLRRAECSRLSDFDRITRAPVRRYVRERPGELLHVDVKKLGRIPDGGGWRLTGRGPNYHDTTEHKNARLGYDHLHLAVDDCTRVLFCRVYSNDKAATCTEFIAQAIQFFAELGVRVERVMTDNAWNYTRNRSLRELFEAAGIRHLTIRPRRPETNGKVERLNKTLLEEFAYTRAFTSNQHRLDELPGWVASYNQRRPHTALGGQSPIQALVNHVRGNYT